MLLNPDRYWWLVPTSFIFAFLWQFWPLPPSVRELAPDAIVAVTLYWMMQRPPRMSSGWALIIGLLRDGIAGTALGTHGLALVLTAYLTQLLAERLRSFALWQQALAVGALCTLYQIIGNLIELLRHAETSLLLPAPIIATTVCWPICFLALNLLEHGYSRRPHRA
ncbi:MAG: rod shape-determining protein MreD [Pseudomonadales bacterium]